MTPLYPRASAPGLSGNLSAWKLVRRQIQALEAQREELLRHSPEPAVQMVLALMRLKAIGVNTAWPFVMEFFAWRDFRNGREIGALSGLAGTPYQSGESARELGDQQGR